MLPKLYMPANYASDNLLFENTGFVKFSFDDLILRSEIVETVFSRSMRLPLNYERQKTKSLCLCEEVFLVAPIHTKLCNY